MISSIICPSCIFTPARVLVPDTLIKRTDIRATVRISPRSLIDRFQLLSGNCPRGRLVNVSARSFSSFSSTCLACIRLNVAHLTPARPVVFGQSYLWFGGGFHSSPVEPGSDLPDSHFCKRSLTATKIFLIQLTRPVELVQIDNLTGSGEIICLVFKLLVR